VRDEAVPTALMVERLLACGAPTVCLVGGLAASFAPWLPRSLQSRLAAPAADAVDGAILMAQEGQDARQPARADG
jgi:N-acetylglucosamine kinase-like BadF-type ATPase